MNRGKRPPGHPGAILKRQYLTPLGVSISEFSETLGVSRKTVSKLVNEHGSVTADMALRLANALNTTPHMWLNLQQRYDLWHAERTRTGWRRVESIAA